MSDTVIRPAKATDLPAIATIYEHAVLHGTATFELTAPDVAEMTRRYRAITEAGLPYLVAATESEIAGYAYAGVYRPRPAYRFTVENSVYLDPRAQRRGIGSRLLLALIEQAGRRGYRQMIAVIGDSENVGSIGVHATLGFRHCGVLRSVGAKFGRWLDAVYMQRALGDGDADSPS